MNANSLALGWALFVGLSCAGWAVEAQVAPARRRQPQRTAAGYVSRHFTPFGCEVPRDWKVRSYAYMGKLTRPGEREELVVSKAPSGKDTPIFTITSYFQTHPRFPSQDDFLAHYASSESGAGSQVSPVQEAKVLKKFPARRFDVKRKGPGLQETYIVMPTPRGNMYYVMRYSAPASQYAAHLPHFEHLLDTFRLKPAQPASEE